jgi:hypothetical protein
MNFLIIKREPVEESLSSLLMREENQQIKKQIKTEPMDDEINSEIEIGEENFEIRLPDLLNNELERNHQNEGRKRPRRVSFRAFEHHKSIKNEIYCEMFECDFCGGFFTKKVALKKHMTEHESVKQCKRCSFTCSTKEKLLNHNSRVHLGLFCKHCNETLKTKRILKSHIEKHENIRIDCTNFTAAKLHELLKSNADLKPKKLEISHMENAFKNNSINSNLLWLLNRFGESFEKLTIASSNVSDAQFNKLIEKIPNLKVIWIQSSKIKTEEKSSAIN